MPTYYKLKVWRGNTFRRPFVMKRKDGSAVDLTGATVKWNIAWPGGAIGKDTSDAGGLVMNAEAGTVEAFLTAEETRSMPLGLRANYELEIWWPSGDQISYLYGDILVSGGGNGD